MITRALVAGAFTAVFLASNTIADKCKLGRIATMDFTGDGDIIIPVSIEGSKVPMAVDTGAPASAVDPVVATNLHLIERRMMQGFMYDRAGEPFTYVAIPHDLALGEMHASNPHLLVWPSPMTKDGHMGGTLAADVLLHFDVDIDFAAHKLNLFSQDHCPGKVVYWTNDNVAVVPIHVVNSGHIVVPVTLDGHSFDAVLDTGSSFTVLAQEAAHNTFGLQPNSSDMTKVSEDEGPGTVPVYRHTFRNLGLEGLSVANPSIDIFENIGKSRTPPHLGSRLSDADESGGNTDLILGLNELQHLHVYIAYKEQKLYITPATAPVAVAAGGAAAAASSTPAAVVH
jgi:predicted aspartyl protease